MLRPNDHGSYQFIATDKKKSFSLETTYGRGFDRCYRDQSSQESIVFRCRSAFVVSVFRLARRKKQFILLLVCKIEEIDNDILCFHEDIRRVVHL